MPMEKTAMPIIRNILKFCKINKKDSWNYVPSNYKIQPIITYYQDGSDEY